MRGREEADIWVCTSPYGFMAALLAAVAAVDAQISSKLTCDHCWRNHVVAGWGSCNDSISQPTETLKGGEEKKRLLKSMKLSVGR